MQTGLWPTLIQKKSAQIVLLISNPLSEKDVEIERGCDLMKKDYESELERLPHLDALNPIKPGLFRAP